MLVITLRPAEELFLQLASKGARIKPSKNNSPGLITMLTSYHDLSPQIWPDASTTTHLLFKMTTLESLT